MSNFWQPFGRLSLAGLVAFGALGLSAAACTTTEQSQPVIADSGSVCTTRESPTNNGELCFINEDGAIRLVGSEILEGSTMTVRGGKGDEMYITVDSAGFGIEISGQILEPPFRAIGTWSDGTPVELVVGS